MTQKNILSILLSFFVFSILSGCVYFNTFYNTKKYFNEALAENKKRTTDRPTAQERQKFDQTINQASKVLQLYPNSKYVDDALLMLGQSFYYLEEYRKSERKFQELIELFPNSEYISAANLWHAKTQIQLQRYDVALEALRTISENAKNKDVRFEAQFWLGETHRLQENFTEASKEYNAALLKIDDNQLKINTYLRLGECYSKLESYNQAAESFHQAAKRSKNPERQFDIKIQYAKALTAAGKPDEAVRILTGFNAADEKNKNYSLARLELANAHLAMQADEKAIDLYNEIIEIYPRTPAAAGAYLALAEYDKTVFKNYKTALDNYKQVKLQAPKSEYAEVAIVHAENLDQLIELQDEIAKLAELLTDEPDEKNVQKEVQQRSDEVDDNIDSARNKLNAKTDKGKPVQRPDQKISAKSRQEAPKLFDDPDAKKGRGLKKIEKSDERTLKNRQTGEADAPAPPKEVVLNPAQKDSVALLVTEKKTEMAELFLYRLEQPDSALFYYLDAISGSSSQKYRALAFYSIANVYDNIIDNSAIRDSVLNILANNYGSTPQGQEAAKTLGLVVLEQKEAPLLDDFEAAQTLLLSTNRPRAAMKKLEDILASSPNPELKKQAIYTLGWINENKLYDNEQALVYYKQLLQDYPDSDHAKKVKKKVDRIEIEKNKAKEKTKALPQEAEKVEPQKQNFKASEIITPVADSAAVKLKTVKNDTLVNMAKTRPDTLNPFDELRKLQDNNKGPKADSTKKNIRKQ